jgi:pimeloyl-ACP methyl ester carboxylesterase
MTPPRLAGELAALLPDARYLGVTDGTHIAPVEFPNAMNPVILEFIKRESGSVQAIAPATLDKR